MDSRSTAVRFMDHVAMIDGHWMWTASLNHGGYGRFAIGGRGEHRTVAAHRMAWTLFRGQIPQGHQIHHVCYVRACVNPDHLDLRTARDNVTDISPLRPPRKPKGPHKQRKTACNAGHSLTDATNLYWERRSNGRTYPTCRECKLARNRAAKRARR